MYIVVCLREVFRRLIEIIFKRRVKEDNTGIAVRSKYELLGLTNKQMNVVDRGLLAGVDVSIYAKKCFNERQMKVLLCGLLLNIDVKKFANFAMSSLEMEYHLYMTTIDTYLGRNYLKLLLQKGDYSIEDKFVKNIIDQDLTKAFEEVAATTRIADNSKESIELNKLNRKLDLRGIKSFTLKLETIENMRIAYRRLEVDYVKGLKNNVVCKYKHSFKECKPTIEDIEKRTIDDIDKEIVVFSKSGRECIYYQVNYNESIYLLGKSLVPIRVV